MAPSLSQMSNLSATSQSGAIGLGVSNSGGGGGLLGASPANMLSFNSPAALSGMGIDLGTPSALLGDAGVGGHAMNLTLSDLGFSSRRGNEDEERRAKLEQVLARLHGGKRREGQGGEIARGRFGRVSEEGVRRVGCWVGMDIDVGEKERKFEGNRQVTIAGKNAVVIDVSGRCV